MHSYFQIVNIKVKPSNQAHKQICDVLNFNNQTIIKEDELISYRQAIEELVESVLLFSKNKVQPIEFSWTKNLKKEPELNVGELATVNFYLINTPL